MTNYEFYKEKINAILCEGVDIALENCQIDRCGNIDCSRCSFYTSDISSCRRKTYEWLVSEYKEPEEDVDWSKVPVDTPVFVRNYDEENWIPGYFAQSIHGEVCIFTCGSTSWSNDNGHDITCWKHAKLAKPEELKQRFHQENNLSKEELMDKLCESYKESCCESAYKEMLEALDNFWNADIKADKKQKIVNMVMELLKMEE